VPYYFWFDNLYLKPIIMKMKTFISIILLFICAINFGQNTKPDRLKGSWGGSIILPDTSIPLIMSFDIENNIITGKVDVPMQSIKGLSIDSIWVSRDSVFTDHSSTIGPGSFYKGLILPGDSVIDGRWLQGGGSFPLRMRPVAALNVPTPEKSNLNPKIEGYKIIKLIESTPIKDQQSTSICWDFATTSFIETEAIRLGKKPVVLSPMFFLIPTYIDKSEKYIRMNGKSYFGPGDLTFSALKAYKNFGAIPEEVYCGKIDKSKKFDHYKMDKKIRDKVNDYLNNGRGNMTTEGYRKSINDILISTIGMVPDTFMYQQKKYTPKSFARDLIGINPDDYIEITSFTHHPFYSRCILEIESNWNNNHYLNLPINDFINTIDYALLHNYSVCWDGDIHEGYNNGFAVLGDNKRNISQKIRQEAFDNHTTEDCHNMHIIGIAENSKGDKFYILKNSAAYKDCGGYLYMSKEYVLLKTISVMVHKNAIPAEILKEVGNNL
jgi:bleomycin hydrolase